jgi:hypothetical protein
MTKIFLIFVILFILCLFKITSNINEHFIGSDTVKDKSNDISFKKIDFNKLYYGVKCIYKKNDIFYDVLNKYNFKLTDDVKQACLIMPCTYETIDNELNVLDKEGIKDNIYGNGVRIFMLNNTDHMASKILLWKYLYKQYGKLEASKIIPYTWDLSDPADFEEFKKQYNPSKIYITKNNKQRQEGIEIHNSIESIEKTKDKYLLVQELLQDPYLINGRKINLRIYVLVIKDTYGNIKLLVYQDGFMYYTPELFEKNDISFERNITTGYVDRQIYIDNPLTHNDFRNFLDDPNRKKTIIEEYYNYAYKNKLSTYIFSQIYQLIGTIFQTYENIIGTNLYGVGFQLYGVDIAINEKLQPMIMEINKGPDLKAKDDRDRELKTKLCTDILKSIGLLNPIDNSEENNFVIVLELINIDDKLIPIKTL